MDGADPGTFWETVGAQLRRPSGPLAHVTGAMMRWVNRGPYRLALADLDVQPKDNVLELGFGPGEGIQALATLAHCGVVSGFDHSEAMVAQATTRNAEAVARGQVRLRVADFTALPLSDASVDRVLAVNVAYFWDDGAVMLQEIGRVLRPGGRMAVYVTDASAMRRWRFASSDTHRTFTDSSLSAYLAQPPFTASDVSVRCVTLAFGIPGLVAIVKRGPSETRHGGPRCPRGCFI